MVQQSDTLKIGLPVVGFGTWQIPNDAAKDAVSTAIKYGYRHIDTAQYYENEEGVGEGIKASEILREEIFVTTKLNPNLANSYDESKKRFHESLKKLELDYVDLFIIHFPIKNSDVRLEQYKALVDLQKEGVVKNIGVSNYGIHHIQEIIDAKLPIPSVNQIEIHPIAQQKELQEFMKEKGIETIAYSSLAPLNYAQGKYKPLFTDFAKKYNISTAQLLYKWALQRGFAILPKSTKEERIKQNIDLFHFEIDQDDMDKLNGLDTDNTLVLKSLMGVDPVKDL